MDRDVKVSVFLPENLHRQLKILSVERGTSLQKVLADLAETAAHSGSEDQETVDALSLMKRRLSSEGWASIGPRTIKTWQARLKQILESGNRLAILHSTTAIEAMEALIGEAPSTAFRRAETDLDAIDGPRRKSPPSPAMPAQ